MRFMMLMIPAIYQGVDGRTAGPNFAPDLEAVKMMNEYNERLAAAGVLESLEGLHPPVTAARVSFEGGTPAVKEAIGRPGHHA